MTHDPYNYGGALLRGDTRMLAFEAIIPHITPLQHILLEALKLHRTEGLTAQQAEDVTGLRQSTVSARLIELVRSGRAYTDGTRKTRSGRSAAIYKVRSIVGYP